MQFAALVPIVLAAVTRAITITWDSTYDSASLSLFDTACSDGSNGLVRADRTMLGDFPSFPYIGGANTIAGWNSPLCGACYQIAYNGSSIYVAAVDSAEDGFNVSYYALNHLTSSEAESLGVIDADVTAGGCPPLWSLGMFI